MGHDEPGLDGGREQRVRPFAREDVLRAMRKAADFYRNKVSTEGGYHYYYTTDLSYGRSESAEGPTQVEVQREAIRQVQMGVMEP